MKIIKIRKSSRWTLSFATALLCTLTAAGQVDNYEFNSDGFSKKAFSLDGYAEFRPVFSWLNRDGAFYKIRTPDPGKGKTLGQINIALLADLIYRKGIFQATLEPYLDHTLSPQESETGLNLFQAHMSLKPSPALAFFAGKRTLRWGKGYAWNPVALVERRKNPNEPDLAREGYWMLTADFTKSFPGILKTLTLTPVIIPSTGSINPDFGGDRGIHFAGKVYILFLDTDIDLILLTGKGRPTRWGLDFSRNLLPNLEIHGEIALLRGWEKEKVLGDGDVQQETIDAVRTLLGLRYLTATETTFILEYYHNGAGHNPDEIDDFFSAVDSAYDQYMMSGDDTQIQELAARQSYTGFSPMTHYLFLRVMQKDIFGTLYLNPAVTAIANLSDGSASLAPELTYRGFTNVELRLKAMIPMGKNREEFGEKANRFRLELRGRYFF